MPCVNVANQFVMWKSGIALQQFVILEILPTSLNRHWNGTLKRNNLKNDTEANALLGRPMLNEWGIKFRGGRRKA